MRIDAIDVGPFGVTIAGGWQTPLNDRLGVSELEEWTLDWTLDREAGTGQRPARSRGVAASRSSVCSGCRRREAGVHPTYPPRPWGGNIDCKELVAGTTLFLPIPVDGALFSAGDGHGRQGDGEVSQLADRVRRRARAS